MIKIRHKGDWARTDNFFKKSVNITKTRDIAALAEKCIEELKAATPKDSGITANSWDYQIVKTKNRSILYITNSNVQNGTNIVMLLEFGHVTATGGWVEGKNFIGPITRDEYNKVLSNTWKELRKL
ncbi:MAG: hypothetical protein ACNA7U_01195 [Candidatus Izemoplasmataceae bacterium]